MKIVKIPQINGLNKTDGCQEAPNEILKSLSEVYSNSRGKSVIFHNQYKKDSINQRFMSFPPAASYASPILQSLIPPSSDIYNLEHQKMLTHSASKDYVSNSNIKISDFCISKNLIEDNDKIYRYAFDSFGNEKVCFLGGDHSISYPISRSFFDWSQHNGGEPSLIVFDSHPDLMEPVDGKIPTHEEWLRALIEDGFDPKNILLVGIRNPDIAELNYIKEKGIRYFSVTDLFLDFRNKTDAITEFAYRKDLYVSFDIDVLDPAYAPGTGYCEPGGLSSKEFLYIVSRIAKIPTLKAFDIVEVNPNRDINNMTCKLAAKVLAEFF